MQTTPPETVPHLAPCTYCGGTAMHGPDCASPEMAQERGANPFADAARGRKVIRLVIVLDGTLLAMRVDPFSREALAYVEAMSERAWQKACEHAPCPPASETTRAQVRAIFAERVARAA